MAIDPLGDVPGIERVRVKVDDEHVLAEIRRMLPPKGDEWLWHTYSFNEIDTIVRWLLIKVEGREMTDD